MGAKSSSNDTNESMRLYAKIHPVFNLRINVRLMGSVSSATIYSH
jgi:hypothetical protein